MNKKKLIALLLSNPEQKYQFVQQYHYLMTDVIKDCIQQQQFTLLNELFESGHLNVKWSTSLIESFFKEKKSQFVLNYLLCKWTYTPPQCKCIYLLASQYGDLSIIKWYHHYLLFDTKPFVFDGLIKACMHNQLTILHEIYISHANFLYEQLTEQQQYYLTLLTCERGHVLILQWLLTHFPICEDVLDERTFMNVVGNELFPLASFLASQFSYTFSEEQLYEIRHVFRQHSIEHEEWFVNLCKQKKIKMELYSVIGTMSVVTKEKCMICYEDSVYQTSCKHYYCHGCLEKHRMFSFTCGMCREPFTEVYRLI
jgi:hypothetical protein